jgi:hypothetical protein
VGAVVEAEVAGLNMGANRSVAEKADGEEEGSGEVER